MELRKVGDWGKVKLLTAHLKDELVRARSLSLKRWGLKAEGTAKTHISRQDLRWQPLSPKYLARKIRSKSPRLSENILVATSSYFNSITSYVLNDTSYAGVKKTAKNKDGEDLANIAAVHEYGSLSRNLPARPLWRPTFSETMEWHIKENQPEYIFLRNLEKYL